MSLPNFEVPEDDSEDSDDNIVLPEGQHTLATNAGQQRSPVRRRRGFDTSSTLRKRPRTKNTDEAAEKRSKKDDDVDVLAEELPCDTEVAIMTLRSQFPGIHIKSMENIPPIILRSQIYSIVASREVVDREVEELRVKGKIRLIMLPGGKVADFAVVHSDDLAYSLRHAKENAKDDKQREALEYFLEDVIPSYRNASITEMELNKGAIKSDRSIELVRAGFLTMKDVDIFHFSVPQVGLLLKNRRAGNKEVLKIVSSKQYNEILLRDLEEKRLRRSEFDTQFHIRDLVGSGQLEVIETTMGKLIRQPSG